MNGFLKLYKYIKICKFKIIKCNLQLKKIDVNEFNYNSNNKISSNLTDHEKRSTLIYLNTSVSKGIWLCEWECCYSVISNTWYEIPFKLRIILNVTKFSYTKGISFVPKIDTCLSLLIVTSLSNCIVIKEARRQ